MKRSSNDRVSATRMTLTPQTQLNNHNYTILSNNIDDDYSIDHNDDDDSPQSKTFSDLTRRIESITLEDDYKNFTSSTTNTSSPTKKPLLSKVKSRNTLLIAMEILDDSFDGVPYKEYANYLGKKSNDSVLRNFVELLKPLPYSLLSVLYKLSSSLYLIAESQNIDRILEEISRQWIQTYPNTVWKGNYKICHIILFSLLILNSDLHNDETKGNHHKFSSEEFVTNTLSAIVPELSATNLTLEDIRIQVSHALLSYYEALKHNALPVLRLRSKSISSSTQIPSPSARNRRSAQRKRSTSYSIDMKRTSSIGNRSLYSSRSNVSLRDSDLTCTVDWKYHHNMALPELYVKESFDDRLIQENCPLWILDSTLYISDDSYRSLKKIQRNSYKNMESSNKNFRANNSSLISFNENGKDERSFDDSSLSTVSSLSNSQSKSSSPFFLRWLKKKSSKQPKHSRYTRSSMAFLESDTQWLKVRVRVNQGRIFIFRSNDSTVSLRDDIENLKRNPQTEYYVFNLIDCTAELLQANIIMANQSASQSTTNFNIKIPLNVDDTRVLFQFQTVHKDKAQGYVDCINFWAARLSSLPDTQFEIVSNEEYGWSDKILKSQFKEDLNSVYLSEWKPLLTIGIFADDIDEMTNQHTLKDKLTELKEFLGKLELVIDEHNDMKPHIIACWDGTRNFDMVMNNWNNKYLFLNKQFQKQTVYFNILKTTYSKYCVQS